MAEYLPRAPWMQRADLPPLVAALGADAMRYVGGAVRDTLLGHDVADVDVATTHLPKAVIAKLDAAGIRNVPTGLDHGTVTAVLPEGPVEITTLRRDVATDGRRATIAFASDWRDDAARRDFTINALYAHPETWEISDYFGGLEDLSSRQVRFIGDAHERIREDHLRILRYFRFQARFGAELDELAEQACTDLAETLTALSRERVAKELLLLLALPDPHATIARMHSNAILPVILPETGRHEVAQLERLIAAETAQGVSPDGMRRLSALLPSVAPVAEAVAVRLRLSRAQKERLGCTAKRLPSDTQTPRRLAYYQGIECARDRLLLAGGDIAAITDWDIPDFPIKGGEIIARGMAAGPEVARMMRTVEARWADEGFPDKARVMAILDEELA